MIAQDVRDLQRGMGQVRRGLRGRLHRRDELPEGAGDLAERLEGDTRAERCRVEFLVPERTRAIMRTFYVIEIESSVERNSVLANDAALSARDTRPGPLF